MTHKRFNNNSRYIVARMSTITLFMSLDRTTGSNRHFTSNQFIRLRQLRAPNRHQIFFRMFLMLHPDNNNSNTRLTAHRNKLRRINHIKATNVTTHTSRHIHFISRSSSQFQQNFSFISRAFRTAFRFAFSTNTNLWRTRIRQRRLSTFRRLQRFANNSTQNRAFSSHNFASTNFASRSQIIFTTANRSISRLTSHTVTTRRQIRFTITNLLDRIINRTFRRQFTQCYQFTINQLFFLQRHGFFRTLSIRFHRRYLMTTTNMTRQITRRHRSRHNLFSLNLTRFGINRRRNILRPLRRFQNRRQITQNTILSPQLRNNTRFTNISFNVLRHTYRRTLQTLRRTRRRIFSRSFTTTANSTTFNQTFRIAANFNIRHLGRLLRICITR